MGKRKGVFSSILSFLGSLILIGIFLAILKYYNWDFSALLRGIIDIMREIVTWSAQETYKLLTKD